MTERASLNAYRVLQAVKELQTRLTPTTTVRATSKVARQFILSACYPYFYNGIPYRIKRRNLGLGVYEFSLEACKDG